MAEVTMEKIVSLCKRRGFIFQSSEIYGGLNGAYDYGPMGVNLKKIFVIFGTIISLFICVITKNPLVVSFTSYWIGLSFSVAVGVFFGWYPAFKASRLSPVEALSRD